MFTKKSLFFVGFFLVSVVLTGCSEQKDLSEQPVVPVSQDESATQQDYTSLQSKVSAEKIEIIEFHATSRCYSCNKMEELMKKTLDENFATQQKNGTISFKAINGELPENRDIVVKYQAGGLSVFINAITNGKDNIVEETQARRLIEDDAIFVSYMTEKINNLLGQ